MSKISLNLDLEALGLIYWKNLRVTYLNFYRDFILIDCLKSLPGQINCLTSLLGQIDDRLKSYLFHLLNLIHIRWTYPLNL